MWKKINNFDYEISNTGEIRNSKNKIIKQRRDKDGYYIVNLYKDGIQYTKKVHRLVAEAFIPNPESKPQIDHIDTNRLNNSVENLKWCTKEENMNNPLTKNNLSKSKKN